MAQESKTKERDDDEDEASDGERSSDAAHVPDDEALARVDEGGDESLAESEQGEEGEEGEGEGEGVAANQLGAERYVLAGFFAAGMLCAYVVGRSLQTAWSALSNKDWFSQNLPRLAAVSDDDRGMYTILLGGLIAIVLVYRTYKRPDVRAWSDEVAAELAKVVWPDRKEVTNSTFIVIVASTVATLYLALLDRLWAFVTNIVYGDGS